MFLKKFKIKNFRIIKDLTLEFNDGVNIIIGENNSGKSTIVDALRICLSYGSQYRDAIVHHSDFFIDKHNPDHIEKIIEFDLFFGLTREEEKGWFIGMLAGLEEVDPHLQLHFKYYIESSGGKEKIRWRVWGGENEGATINQEEMDKLTQIYLEPLRDAVHYLRPIRGNKLGSLFSDLVNEESKRNALAGKVKKILNDDEEWKEVIADGKTKVNEHLKKSSVGGKEQDIEINFLPVEFRNLVENLRIQMPVYKTAGITPDKQKYFELSQNGLGLNNLIYIAIILGNLKYKKETEPDSFIALLIEEPEAHLHPQLQNILFTYLTSLNKIGFQIFISTHSPTLTAKAELDSIIVVQNQNNKIHSLCLRNSNLTIENKIYLRKFLDVTKSQLFFANGVILVEGISEALLLSTFSRIMGEEYDLEKNGIEVVNISGVAFSHFANLFNSEEQSKRLNSRCAIITDDDRDVNDIESPRAQKALDLLNGLLKVELAKHTFEYELFATGDNKDILLEIFKELKPRTSQTLSKDESLEKYGLNFVEKIKDVKSELAHRLSIMLEEKIELREKFVVPDYIKAAIKWVIKGE